jgi:FkbM family methyltransferase
MKFILAACIRFFSGKLLYSNSTYFLGMVFIRLGRKLKKGLTSKQYQEQNTLVSNFGGNVKMWVDINSYMGGSIFWCGFHHVAEVLFLNRFLKPESVFVDIGANQGEFSMFAASQLPLGKVYAFEPVKKQFERLKENKQLNQFHHVELFNFGLSDKPGTLPIYTSEDTSLHSGWHDGLSTLYAAGDRNILQQEVELKVFDAHFLSQLTRLDVVKIDIEGAELYALKGMKEALIKFKPAVLIEMNNDTFKAAGYSIEVMDDFLRRLGYKAHAIKHGKLHEVKKEDVFVNWANYVYK